MTVVKLKRKPPKRSTPAEDSEKRPRRALTDDTVTAVHLAREAPGTWIELDRPFKSRENAHSTASCLRRGFLRVRPQEGEPTYILGDHVYLALPAKPEVNVERKGNVWRLRIRVVTG